MSKVMRVLLAKRNAAEKRARRYERASAELRSVVRVFPDYADTVIWFTEGPVPYEETGLSPELIAAMTVWEEDYYKALGPELTWPSKTARTRHAETGREIATKLGDEIGGILEIEVFDARGKKVRFRAPGEGTNPSAVAAFRAMAEAAEDEATRRAAQIRSGAEHRSSWDVE